MGSVNLLQQEPVQSVQTSMRLRRSSASLKTTKQTRKTATMLNRKQPSFKLSRIRLAIVLDLRGPGRERMKDNIVLLYLVIVRM